VAHVGQVGRRGRGRSQGWGMCLLCAPGQHCLALVASNPTSLSRWAPTLPHVPRYRKSPPWRGGLLRRRYVSRDIGSRLLVEVSSSATTYPSAPDLASLPRWVLTLPHVSWLRAMPPRGGSFGAAMCPTAPDGPWATEIKKA
jgi:hypothetical protein